jgi:L-iditol 2-dehydrogenase
MNIMNDKVLGAFSEYIRIPEHVVRQNVFKKPENISFDEAAILEPLACVVHPYSLLHVEDIKNAVIIGAGPIGLLHVLFLKSKGIKAIVSDLNEERLKVARSVGADVTTSPDALENYVNHDTNDMGADLVVECTGIPHVWEKSVDYVRSGGTVILFGGCKAGTSVAFDTHRIHYDEITVKGSFHFTPLDVRYAYDLLTENILNVTPLISGSVDLKNIISVFQDLKNGM